jgi:carboxypeptidase C (cathepsin A)
MILKLKRQYNQNTTNNKNYYEWIDKKILANPFPDYRKIIVDLILAPYLINIKKLSYQESYQIIREWLDKCNSLQKLDNYSNFVNYMTQFALKTAASKGIRPMSLYKIKTDIRYSNNLYLLILQNKMRKDMRSDCISVTLSI